MSDDHPHHLLAQVPLTVSPFLSLPTGTTLPYTYKQLPSTLPPSALDPPAPPTTGPSDLNSSQPHTKPQYIMSSTGHSAHPDDIIASCKALQDHLVKLQKDAESIVGKWEEGIRERELMEKRRVAPGWLDSRERMLVPARKGEDVMMQDMADGVREMGMGAPGGQVQVSEELERRKREGEELDRAFGGMEVNK